MKISFFASAINLYNLLTILFCQQIIQIAQIFLKRPIPTRLLYSVRSQDNVTLVMQISLNFIRKKVTIPGNKAKFV